MSVVPAGSCLEGAALGPQSPQRSIPEALGLAFRCIYVTWETWGLGAEQVGRAEDTRLLQEPARESWKWSPPSPCWNRQLFLGGGAGLCLGPHPPYSPLVCGRRCPWQGELIKFAL